MLHDPCVLIVICFLYFILNWKNVKLYLINASSCDVKAVVV
jgi:hypothetical protein